MPYKTRRIIFYICGGICVICAVLSLLTIAYLVISTGKNKYALIFLLSGFLSAAAFLATRRIKRSFWNYQEQAESAPSYALPYERPYELPYGFPYALPDDFVLTDEFKETLQLLENGKNIFLTGAAGTGKSTLIRHFLNSTPKNAMVVAPTGVAALNVGGCTIHSFLSINLLSSLASVMRATYYPRRYGEVIKNLDVLVIDEISMVRADLFDILETVLRRFGPHPGQPFGGVQIVLTGDLFQLPPIVLDEEIPYFKTVYSSPYFFAAAAYFMGDFQKVNLTQIFRQAEDEQLAEILNKVRDGSAGEAECAILNSHTDPNFVPPPGEFWLTLATRNHIVNEHNELMLSQLDTELHEYEAEISGDVRPGSTIFEKNLRYKVGAQVMMLTNEPHGYWVNGTVGKIIAIEYDRYKKPNVVIRPRTGYEFIVKPMKHTVTHPKLADGKIIKEAAGSISQLPFKLAWAITIHKSQGQSLENIVVDLGTSTFATGQLYVALSRAKNLSGLVLKRPIQPADLQIDQRVRRFLNDGMPEKLKAPRAYLAANFVGKKGRFSQPRPIEIAVVHSDGREITSLINPQTDIADAEAEFGISAADIAFAPTTAAAWPAILDVLAGSCPVGIDVDEILSNIDAELKRGGIIAHMPLGINIPKTTLSAANQESLQHPSALEKARALRTIAENLLSDQPVPEVFSPPERAGFILPRGSKEAGIIFGGAPDEQGRDFLRWELSARTAKNKGIYRSDVDKLLRIGTRVCFSGTVVNKAGSTVPRRKMEELAIAHRLIPDTDMTPKCEVLIISEASWQSPKTHDAARWGKPIILAQDFLDWVGNQER